MVAKTSTSDTPKHVKFVYINFYLSHIHNTPLKRKLDIAVINWHTQVNDLHLIGRLSKHFRTQTTSVIFVSACLSVHVK